MFATVLILLLQYDRLSCEVKYYSTVEMGDSNKSSSELWAIFINNKVAAYTSCPVTIDNIFKALENNRDRWRKINIQRINAESLDFAE